MQDQTNVALATLEIAIEPYKGLSLKTVRALIRSGQLPFVKAGRSYMIRPADLAALLAPKACVAVVDPVASRRSRENARERSSRQLAAAGIR